MLPLWPHLLAGLRLSKNPDRPSSPANSASLVRGKRTAYVPKVEEQQVAEAKKNNNRMLMLYIAGILAAILVICVAYILHKKFLNKEKR